MLRLAFITVLAGVLGSVLATFVFVISSGGTGLAQPIQFIAGWSAFTMLFTIPGAFLLLAVQNFLSIEHRARAALATAVFGVVAGALILGVSAQTLLAAAIGGLYGFCTAAAFLSLQQIPSGKRNAKT